MYRFAPISYGVPAIEINSILKITPVLFIIKFRKPFFLLLLTILLKIFDTNCKKLSEYCQKSLYVLPEILKVLLRTTKLYIFLPIFMFPAKWLSPFA